MTAKTDACKQAWERHCQIQGFGVSELSDYESDFKAGFDAGYAAGLQSNQDRLELQDAAAYTRRLQSELERRLGVKLVDFGWHIELADSDPGEYDLVCPRPGGSRVLYYGTQNDILGDAGVIGRYRIL